MSIEILSKENVYLGSAEPSSGSGGQTINNEDINITANGVYTASEGYTGIGTATVNVAGGEIVTATNSTGTAITSGSKVWLEERGGGVEDFTKYNEQNFTITDGIMDLPANGSGINGSIYKSFAEEFNTPQEYLEIVVKFKPSGWNNTNTPSYTYGAINICGTGISSSGVNSMIANSPMLSLYTPASGTNNILITSLYGTNVSAAIWHRKTLISSEFVDGSKWYWVKLRITTTTTTASWSYDGIDWISSLSASGNYLQYVGSHSRYHSISGGIRDSSNILGCIVDLSNCYVKADDVYWWEPYKNIQPSWHILPYLYSSSNSFTGLAQENIAIAESGEVMTILPEQMTD